MTSWCNLYNQNHLWWKHGKINRIWRVIIPSINLWINTRTNTKINTETNTKPWIYSFWKISIQFYNIKILNFKSLDKTPQYYIDRYNDEVNYKSWIDSQFPWVSIYNILGYPDPILVPDWIRNNAEWWATGAITDSTFISGIDFMLKNNIIMISNIPFSGNIYEDEIPDWIRNNAHWWSQNLISEDEFVNSEISYSKW